MAQALIRSTDENVLDQFTFVNGGLEVGTYFSETLIRNVGEPCWAPFIGVSPAIEMDVLAEMMVASGSSGGGRSAGGLGVVMSADAVTGQTAETTLSVSGAGNIERAILYTNGDRVIGSGPSPSPVVIDEWHFLRVKLHADGQCEITRWNGSVSTPTNVADYIATVPSSHLIPRYPGIGMRNPQRRTYFRWLGVGTNGDPAPTGPVDPGGSRRRSPLLLTPR